MRLIVAVVLMLIHAGTASGQLSGRIYDAHTGVAVAGAMLEVVDEAPRRVTHSTADGLYAFSVIPAGESCLRVIHPGYETAHVCVVSATGRRLVVDLSLTPRPFPLQGIRVVASRGATSAAPEVRDGFGGMAVDGPIGVSGRALPVSPVGGLMASLGAGIAPGQPDRTRAHTLHIWSAGSERGLVLLDGVALSAPLHLGALLPLLDPELLGSADSRVGGAAPRHDGGAAQVLELSSRQAQPGSRLWIAADLISSRAGAELASERAGLVAGARRVNSEIINGALADPFGYAYRDGLIRGDLRVGERVRLEATGFGTVEELSIPRDLAHDFALWSNVAVSARARVHDDGGAEYATRMAYSRGHADLPVLSALGGHQAASLDRLVLSAERQSPFHGGAVSAGFDLEQLTFRRAFRSDADAATATAPQTCDAHVTCTTREFVAAVFGDLSTRLPGSVTARVGARLRYAAAEQRVDVMPRLLITRSIGAGMLTLGAGIFTQSVLLETDDTLRMTTAWARHLEAGIAQGSGRTLLKAGVYVRQDGGGTTATTGTLAPGAEVGFVQRTRWGELSANYAIERSPAMAGRPATYRRLAAVGATAGGRVWRSSLGASYAAGFPPTSIVLERPTELVTFISPRPESADADVERGRSYFRFDGTAGTEWPLRAAGREFMLMPYVRVLNTLRHRESVFYYNDAGQDGSPQPLARLPVVPVIGVRIEF